MANVTVPSSNGIVDGGATALAGWCAVDDFRTLRMGGVLGSGAEILGGINAAVWRHHLNFNETWDRPVIISVGYQVKSSRGTQFRIWRTNTIREHLVRGYTLNRQRFERNARELEAALALVRRRSATNFRSIKRPRTRVRHRALHADLSAAAALSRRPAGRTTARRCRRRVADNRRAAWRDRAAESGSVDSSRSNEAFAREREEGLASLPGNLDQSVFGNAAYPTIESKAAQLLYVVISNLAFSDSNKH